MPDAEDGGSDGSGIDAGADGNGGDSGGNDAGADTSVDAGVDAGTDSCTGEECKAPGEGCGCQGAGNPTHLLLLPLVIALLDRRSRAGARGV